MKNKNIFYKRSGFTLIEIIMVVLIVALISIPASRFFKKQIEFSTQEKHRLAFRSEYLTFILKLRWEFRIAEKESATIFDDLGNAASRGVEIQFTYIDPKNDSDLFIGYRYDKNKFNIIREVWNNDWGAVLSQKVVMKGVQEYPGIDMFVQDDNFETVTITVAPHGRGPIPNGSESETLSTKIAPRN